MWFPCGRCGEYICARPDMNCGKCGAVDQEFDPPDRSRDKNESGTAYVE